jgi:mRNA interferase YafQ
VRDPVRSGRRDVKRAARRGKDMSRLRELISLLLAEAPLPDRYRDHPLKGSWRGYRDAHIEPDWLLIYGVASPSGTDRTIHTSQVGTRQLPDLWPKLVWRPTTSTT